MFNKPQGHGTHLQAHKQAIRTKRRGRVFNLYLTENWISCHVLLRFCFFFPACLCLQTASLLTPVPLFVHVVLPPPPPHALSLSVCPLCHASTVLLFLCLDSLCFMLWFFCVVIVNDKLKLGVLGD